MNFVQNLHLCQNDTERQDRVQCKKHETKIILFNVEAFCNKK